MKVVVIGGSGYEGSFIVQELLKKKYNVSVFDIVEPPFECEFYNYKFADLSRISEISRSADSIIYCNMKSNNMLISDYYHNAYSLMCVSQLANFFKVPTMIYLGSSEIYQDHNKIISENHQYYNSNVEYLNLEATVLRNNHNATIFRMGETMGQSPNMDWNKYVNKLTVDAYTKQTISGMDNKNNMPWLHLHDLVSAINLVITKELSGIYNLCTENEPPHDVALRIGKMSDSTINWTDQSNRSLQLNCAKFSYFDYEAKYYIPFTYSEICKELDALQSLKK